MSEHYGQAPCDCWRRPSTGGYAYALCDEHHCRGCDLGIHNPRLCDYPLPWHAASAIEAGLRAIAQAPKPKGEHGPCPICGDESGCGYPGPFPGLGATISLPMSCQPIESSDTERPKPFQVTEPKPGEGVHEIKPEQILKPKPTCYWCGKCASDLVMGKCSKCGNEQPPGET